MAISWRLFCIGGEVHETQPPAGGLNEMKQSAPYRTFVIRCWQEQSGQPGSCVYRFSLEVPATGERFGFTRAKDLIQALELALAQSHAAAIADGKLGDEPTEETTPSQF